MNSKFNWISLSLAVALILAGGVMTLARPLGGRQLSFPASSGVGLGLAFPSNAQPLRPSVGCPRQLPATESFSIREDFSGFDKGTEDEPDSETLASSYFKGGKTIEIDDDLMQSPGWTGSDCYMAGGTCALVSPTFEQAGYLNTPLGDYSGHVKVKCRMKAICTVEDDEWSLEHDANVMVVMASGGYDYPQVAEIADLKVVSDAGRNAERYVQLSLDRADGWKEVEFSFNNNSSQADSYLQFSVIGGIALDDIEIDVDGSYLPYPSVGDIGDFTLDSFTINWHPIRFVDEFEVNVTEFAYNGGDDIVYTHDFENGEIPAWLTVAEEESSYDVAPNVGVDGSKGLKMYSGASVSVVSIDSRMKNGSFWLGGSRLDDTSVLADARFYVDAFDGCEWTNLITFYRDELNLEGSIDFNEWFAYTGGFEDRYFTLRFRVEGLPEGIYVVIDDLSLNMGAGGVVTDILSDASCSANSCRIEGIDAGRDYFYSITSVKGDERHTSPMHTVIGVPAPAAYEATEIDRRGSYVASWSECPRATNFEVHNFGVTDVKNDHDDYLIIDEDFDECVQGTRENPSPLYNDRSDLDDYTVMPGWEGENNICAEGMLGCSNSEYGSYIVTPYLNLDHDDSYQLYIKAFGTPGDVLVFMTSEGRTFYIPFDTTDDGVSGVIDDTFTVPDPEFLTYSLIMSAAGQPFLIDHYTVRQSVKAPDTVLTWLGAGFYDNTVRSHKFQNFKQYDFETYGFGVFATNRGYGGTELRSGMSNLIRVSLTPDSVDDIVAGEPEIDAVYTVDGLRLDSLKPGINIVHYSDGTSRKIMVR